MWNEADNWAILNKLNSRGANRRYLKTTINIVGI